MPRGASIVNLGYVGVSKLAATAKTGAYSISKTGLLLLTRCLALELGPRGIRVNMVAPGYIFTDRWEKLADDKVKRRRLNCPIGLEATRELRIGAPTEVAAEIPA